MRAGIGEKDGLVVVEVGFAGYTIWCRVDGLRNLLGFYELVKRPTRSAAGPTHQREWYPLPNCRRKSEDGYEHCGTGSAAGKTGEWMEPSRW